MDTYYEIYVKPDRGPCTVQERDSKNNFAWPTEHEAIEIAKQKHKLYPNIHFLVHKITGRNRTASFSTDSYCYDDEYRQ